MRDTQISCVIEYQVYNLSEYDAVGFGSLVSVLLNEPDLSFRHFFHGR